jgi:spore germination cell wall hydrolase CwlJ-like protein
MTASTAVEDNRSSECLAMNMYHEARNQGTAGILAVSAVVLNRVNDHRFPDTICEVVEQGPTRASWQDPMVRFPIKNKCQFSWYCDGKSDVPHNKVDYQYFLELSTAILSYELPFLDITDGATFYHADYVMPSWAKTKTRTIEIEDHIFYRWD